MHLSSQKYLAGVINTNANNVEANRTQKRFILNSLRFFSIYKKKNLKGLRITEFPYLLTIQLKRFDFDYQTLHRIKLNDRITFPDYLDINNFLYTPPPSTPKMSYAAAAKK